MSCFEIVHNISRFIGRLRGKNILSLDDFYFKNLEQRGFLEKAKAMKPSERLAMILLMDKQIFENWKKTKDLEIHNNLILALSVASVLLAVFK